MTSLWAKMGEFTAEQQWRNPPTLPGWNKIQYFAFLWIVLLLSPAADGQTNDYPPTMFTNQPRAGSPEVQGNTKVLLCYANGNPPPVYRWKKDGGYTSASNVTDTTLKINNIQRSHAGEYQCVASNAHGAILSDRVHVHVAYMVPFANTGNKEKSVDQGQACVIDLPPIDSYPSPNIQWFEGYGAPIHAEGQRYHVTLKHQLIILEPRLADNNKLFKASAVNMYTGQSSDSQTFVLKVTNVGSFVNDIPPEIVSPPLHTTAVQNDDASVTLECVANARPLNYLSLNWYKRTGPTPTDRVKIEQNTDKYLLSMYRRRLTIKNPVTEDSAVYLCEAEFNRPGDVSFTPVSAQANLTVKVKPAFVTRPPLELSQDVGTSVTIPCTSVGTPTPTVTWYRNAEEIDYDTETRYSQEESGNLVVTDLLPADSGMFQCFVSNNAGEINTAMALKVLSSPPAIVSKPQNVSVIDSDSVRFQCQVTGAPQPDIRWYRVTSRGSEDLPGALGNVQILDQELLITQANVDDSGRYYCNATNNKGMDVASAYLTVTLRTRIKSPPQDASVIKGSTTVLQCGVSHDPDVRVAWRWYHNAAQIPPDDPRRQINDADGSLQIRSVRNSDIGTFMCAVTSLSGNDTGSAQIKVIELPYPPSITSVELNPKSNRSVDVTWSPGFDGNSPINSFIVQYRNVPQGVVLYEDEGWYVASSSVPFSQQSYTVTGLKPARSYQFRVSAVNDVGEGPPSQHSITKDLPQEPPSGPPRGVVGSARSNSSIIIQWQPPDEDKWNGNLDGYTVRYKPSNYPQNTEIKENVTNYLVTIFELKGLLVNQEYVIAVAAFNKIGTGVYSDPIRVRTHEGKPSVPPSDVNAEPVNSTAIKLTWMPPNTQFINGLNLGYKVEGKTSNVVEIRTTILSDMSNLMRQQTTYLTSLAKFTRYSLTVLCFTSAGDGPWSLPVTATTLEDVPDPVGDLTFDQVLDTSLRVNWSPPENLNGLLVGYTLSYMKKNQTISKVTKELEPSVSVYTIQGLSATTVYTIEVFANTRVGPGPPQTADIESGVPPEQPASPRNLAITNIKATSVLLQFIPGFDGHTSISKWVVQAQLKAQQEADEWTTVYEVSKPNANAITVEGLKPYTAYRLRMTAVNIAGESPVSTPTLWFDTIQAPPASPPPEVTVRAVNETALRVRWTPLSVDLWHGLGRGYSIQVKMAGAVQDEWTEARTVDIGNENANSYIVLGLEEWMNYAVRVASFNTMGHSPYSPQAETTTRESVPSAGPANVSAIALSSTSIKVSWMNVPEIHQNGMIRGYKVQYSSNDIGLDATFELIESNLTMEKELTGLKKYVTYEIQVLAFTRIGDGALSEPSQVVRTHEDVPGAPSRIYFPAVTWTTAAVHWSAPREPNGLITGYSVAYRQKVDPPSYAVVHDQLPPSRHDFNVSRLSRDTFYVFSLKAKTGLGWGEEAVVEVRTIVDRSVPEAPHKPQIGPSQISDRWVTISWHPGNDGYGPIRNYTIQVQRDNQEWADTGDYVPSTQNTHSITGLKPNTQYKFRVAAWNDVGMSPFSASSEQIRTKQAAPESPPVDLTAVPQTTTSILVTWKPPPASSWNGAAVSYEVYFAQLPSPVVSAGSLDQYQQRSVPYPGTRALLTGLTPRADYEVKVAAKTSWGLGVLSRPLDFYVGEAVPTASPQNIEAFTVSSTSIRVVWAPPPEDTQNGDLLGYKVFYWMSSPAMGSSSNLRRRRRDVSVDGAMVKTVAATETEALLDTLEMYRDYSLIMLAFNAAGDGPNSTVPITRATDQGSPGPPGMLVFTVTSLSSLNVTWPPPAQPNGVIELYEISYYQDIYVDGESRSVQVKIAGDKRYYTARELSENVVYIFSVRAKTKVGWGNPSVGNITTGPQPGSPAMPERPTVVLGDTTVTIQWRNGYSGETVEPITGYILQIREKGEDSWEELSRLNSADPVFEVSFRNLRPSTQYQFRVIARNAAGISAPSTPSEFLQTADNEQKPFYQHWWFLVIVALTGVIFIIVVVSLLCLTGRHKPSKYKERSSSTATVNRIPMYPSLRGGTLQQRSRRTTEPAITIPRTTVTLSNQDTSSVEGGNGTDTDGFTTFEMRRSQRSVVGGTGSRRRPRNKPMPHKIHDTLPPYSSNSLRSPPRPSPGSVNYSDADEETTHKSYPDDNSSSLTDKPSDISDSEASDDDDDDEKDPPPPFPNHYVNGDVRHSWHRRDHGPIAAGAAGAAGAIPSSSHHHHQQPPPSGMGGGSGGGAGAAAAASGASGPSGPYNAYSYTDSEVDSNYAVSLNGGHVIMNNMAGSRAPLPGFSSFV